MSTDIIEQSIEVDQIQEEVKSISDAISEQFEVLTNLMFVEFTLKKLGLTKDFLLLVNQNNELSMLLGLELPSCEELEASNSFDPEAYQVSEESFSGRIKEGIAKIIEWFKKFLAQIAELFGKLKIKATTIKAKMSGLKPKLSDPESEKTFAPEVEVKMVSYAAWHEVTAQWFRHWDKLTKENFHTLMTSLEQRKIFYEPPESVKLILQAFGHAILSNSRDGVDHFIVAEIERPLKWAIPAEESSLHELGWDRAKIIEEFKNCEKILAIISEEQIIKSNYDKLNAYNEKLMHLMSKGAMTEADLKDLKSMKNIIDVYGDILDVFIEGTLKWMAMFGRFVSHCNAEDSELTDKAHDLKRKVG